MNSATHQLPAILGGEPLRPEGPPGWPLPDPEVMEALERAYRDGSWGQYRGQYVNQLRDELAGYLGSEHVETCSSGTVAIEIALRGAGVQAGDEVILSAYDFKGNFVDVLALGAAPVLVDLLPGNWCLDPAQLPEAVTDKTKAIIVSHLHGGVVSMPEIMEFADEHGLAVVEDAAQMPGSLVHGRRAGTTGHVGVISFGGSKLLSAGRGGAFFTDDSRIAQRAKLHCQRGNDAFPLSELQASVLLPQLGKLDKRNRARSGSVLRLTDSFGDESGLNIFRNPASNSEPGHYKLGFQYDPAAFSGLGRDLFAKCLRAEGIAMSPGFRSLHAIHAASRYRPVGDLPVAEAADAGVLVLHHPVLLGEHEDLLQIIQAVERIRSHAAAIVNKIQDTHEPEATHTCIRD